MANATGRSTTRYGILQWTTKRIWTRLHQRIRTKPGLRYAWKMKLASSCRRNNRLAMTLLEVIAVVIVVLVLAALLLPVSPHSRRPQKVVMARVEIAGITTAIEGYRESYGRYPVPTKNEISAQVAKNDFTYGGPDLNLVLGGGAKTPLNSDVMAALMDLTNYPNGGMTANANHQLNPERRVFLNAKFSGDTNSPGIGSDMVYRDPWGHPFVISMDLNADGRCRDEFYKRASVSRRTTAAGFDRLTNNYDTTGASDMFELSGGVMVWSFGPDGKADKSCPATTTPNKDNVASWQ